MNHDYSYWQCKNCQDVTANEPCTYTTCIRCDGETEEITEKEARGFWKKINKH